MDTGLVRCLLLLAVFSSAAQRCSAQDDTSRPISPWSDWTCNGAGQEVRDRIEVHTQTRPSTNYTSCPDNSCAGSATTAAGGIASAVVETTTAPAADTSPPTSMPMSCVDAGPVCIPNTPVPVVLDATTRATGSTTMKVCGRSQPLAITGDGNNIYYMCGVTNSELIQVYDAAKMTYLRDISLPNTDCRGLTACASCDYLFTRCDTQICRWSSSCGQWTCWNTNSQFEFFSYPRVDDQCNVVVATKDGHILVFAYNDTLLNDVAVARPSGFTGYGYRLMSTIPVSGGFFAAGCRLNFRESYRLCLFDGSGNVNNSQAVGAMNEQSLFGNGGYIIVNGGLYDKTLTRIATLYSSSVTINLNYLDVYHRVLYIFELGKRALAAVQLASTSAGGGGTTAAP